MAGRAGRRGKDDKGIVMYLPIREPETPELVKEMMTGKRATVESQMIFDYSYVLATLGSGKMIQNDTYWMQQNKDEFEGYYKELTLVERELEEFDMTLVKQCQERETIQNAMRSSVNAEKKKFQQELSKWDNSHMGPKWEVANKKYMRYIGVLNTQKQLQKKLAGLQSFLGDIENRTSFLLNYGYIQDNTLTHKGVLASEVHEAHPILLTEIYTRKLLHNENANTILETLSCFLDDVQIDEPLLSTPCIEQIRSIANDLHTSELVKTHWTLTDYWHAVVGDWLEGNNYVCEQYGVEHGNFVRAMLKLANILREWVNLATLQQDTAMIEKMNGMEQNLVRGFVIPDSLYLRI
jgi:superfamily II RNA helicase